MIIESVRDLPKRIMFAEGEDEKMVRAATSFHKGYGIPILIRREDRVQAVPDRLGLVRPGRIEVRSARLSALADRDNARYAGFLFERLRRRGYPQRDVQRMVNRGRDGHPE